MGVQFLEAELDPGTCMTVLTLAARYNDPSLHDHAVCSCWHYSARISADTRIQKTSDLSSRWRCRKAGLSGALWLA